MYYETKIINGILHERFHPDDSFKACSPNRITQSLIETKEKYINLLNLINNKLPDFLYNDDGIIKTGTHGDIDVTEEWEEWKEELLKH
jgi:hypothetical protein